MQLASAVQHRLLVLALEYAPVEEAAALASDGDAVPAVAGIKRSRGRSASKAKMFNLSTSSILFVCVDLLLPCRAS
jgi:hypothetical protein